ncbi:hypothetical protein RG97_12360 [Salmonella enterica]|nr:hypothetical protein [Salmonella enterica subsp. enterica]EAW9673228.1 hypothetical protein [Salmonella enterica]EDW0630821.1 hypothetical protein [Salmonella enterica subsp. enterica serovar Anatum]EAY5851955.1 hypothetical protein [Salmonella enterica]EBA2166911.1 hypothetical protein [Salmonella enterica]
MKKILAIATLTAASITSAHATVTPTNSNSVTSNPVVNTYSFDYNATAPSVAPQFDTIIKESNPIAARSGTVLADTKFNADQVSTVYEVAATYAGDNQNSYAAAFSENGGDGNQLNTFATVNRGDVVHIVLLKEGEVTPGTTTVTYTVTGYHA